MANRKDRWLSAPGGFFYFTVGSAVSRDYASLASFISAFDNTLIDIPGSTVVVEMFNDTASDQLVIETGALAIACPTNVKEFSLTVSDDDWHKGDASKGIVIRRNVSGGELFTIDGSSTSSFVVERLIFDGNNLCTSNGAGIIKVDGSVPSSWIGKGVVIQNCMVFGGNGTYSSGRYTRGIVASSRPCLVRNCVIGNLLSSGSASSSSAYGIGGDDQLKVDNCLIFGVDFTNGTGTSYGVTNANHSSLGWCRNTIIMDINGDCLNSTVQATNVITDDATGTSQSTLAAEIEDVDTDLFYLAAGATAENSGYSSAGQYEDITGKLRLKSSAHDAGPFNNLTGYETESGGGSGYSLHPLAYN